MAHLGRGIGRLLGEDLSVPLLGQSLQGVHDLSQPLVILGIGARLLQKTLNSVPVSSTGRSLCLVLNRGGFKLGDSCGNILVLGHGIPGVCGEAGQGEVDGLQLVRGAIELGISTAHAQQRDLLWPFEDHSLWNPESNHSPGFSAIG